MSSKKKTIPQEVYDKEYILSDSLEGYEEFQKKELSIVKMKQLDMLTLEKGMTILEVGFGRGELLYHCAKKGAKVAGIDYSEAAFEVAQDTLHEFPEADIRIADCRSLPFEDNYFERVCSGDVIEHLNYEDGILMLKEMHRVLKPGGFMLIHTSPNTVFMKLIYPWAKYFLKLVNRDVVRILDHECEHVIKKVHICEYNLVSLKRIAKKVGLTNAEVWIDSDILRSGKHRHTKSIGESPLMKFVGSLGRYSMVRFLLGNDLYLKYHKK